MSYADTTGPGPAWTSPATTDGVIGRRLLAYLVDIVVLFLFTLFLGFLIGLAGFVTFGLSWTLYAVLVPGAALLYAAMTVGGAAQATPGMRMMGVSIHDAATGGPPGPLIAAGHALLFYVAAGTFFLLVLDVAIGLMREDRRLGHDLLAGVVALRR
ncbi:MAG: RDD family protein [Methylobacteriaceae bacterium]|nr:RDD family protein [Methylobacteriaceae bacterium]